MAQFQSYAYVSSNINGDQKELFLHQHGNEARHSKAFFSQQSEKGRTIKSLRGKTVNHNAWTVEANNNGKIMTHPYEHYGSWFEPMPLSLFHSIEEALPMVLPHPKNDSLVLSPFQHPFFDASQDI